MPYIGKKPADIIATAVDTTTGKFSGEIDAASLDISGNIDVDGTTNLDVVDIDGAVDMASTLTLSGNGFVGATAEFVDGTGTGDKGIQLNPIGLTVSTRNGGISGIFGRQASDGDILQFRKNGSAVGSIRTVGADIVIESEGDQSGLRFRSAAITAEKNTSASDGTVDLGESNARFKDLYLSSGIFLGGTGSANELDDYEEGTWTAKIAGNDGNESDTTVTGNYTKIGNLVYAEFASLNNVNTTGIGSTAILNIKTLPFTVGNTGALGHISANILNFSTSTNVNINVSAAASSTIMSVIECNDNGGRNSLAIASITDDQTDFSQVTIMYRTA